MTNPMSGPKPIRLLTKSLIERRKTAGRAIRHFPTPNQSENQSDKSEKTQTRRSSNQKTNQTPQSQAIRKNPTP